MIIPVLSNLFIEFTENLMVLTIFHDAHLLSKCILMIIKI